MWYLNNVQEVTDGSDEGIDEGDWIVVRFWIYFEGSANSIFLQIRCS